jgi:hypothetical protein
MRELLQEPLSASLARLLPRPQARPLGSYSQAPYVLLQDLVSKLSFFVGAEIWKATVKARFALHELPTRTAITGTSVR